MAERERPSPTQKGEKVSNTAILQGDCLTELSHVPEESVDLIVTSPPYAEARKDTYGGIRPGDYVAWFLPRRRQTWKNFS